MRSTHIGHTTESGIIVFAFQSEKGLGFLQKLDSFDDEAILDGAIRDWVRRQCKNLSLSGSCFK